MAGEWYKLVPGDTFRVVANIEYLTDDPERTSWDRVTRASRPILEIKLREQVQSIHESRRADRVP